VSGSWLRRVGAAVVRALGCYCPDVAAAQVMAEARARAEESAAVPATWPDGRAVVRCAFDSPADLVALWSEPAPVDQRMPEARREPGASA
jgi:hypothetical protein